MLKKSDIDRNLEKYVRQNRARGYSRESIKQTLLRHGYDENYIERFLHRENEFKFVNRYSIIAIFIFLAIVAVANLKLINTGLTGFVIDDKLPNKYLAMDISNINYTLTINNIKIVEAQGIIGDAENTGYLFVIEADTRNSFYQVLINGSNQVYIPYNSTMKKIEIYEGSNLMLEVELSRLI